MMRGMSKKKVRGGVKKKRYKTYNTAILEGIMSKLNKTQGSKKIKPITIGNNTTQQKDIS
jgi:hypothetical protein